ncbi:UPF0149 family protein [Rhodoferax sp.]|uniref:UPF0149 family protein n=1 Tax=Rhodoferax sp. TaxID=50421 RepID=UPI0026072D02|nr:UPF0149 family protein [Rhodoferax sp.]MDD2926662.1 UPF0149 family protein [Rhodoferax sp.]
MNPPLLPAHPAPAEAVQIDPCEPLSADEFAALTSILNYLRARHDAIPTWEFCEGFMAALICCRRPIPPDDYLPVLLPVSFANAVQRQHFLTLWTRRWLLVSQALAARIEALTDATAYQPELLDARADFAALPEAERAQRRGEKLPAFGQLWAKGFMAVVTAWPQDWAVSRNREAIRWRATALDLVAALTQDDTEPPTLHAFEDAAGPPTVSIKRMKAFGDALWSVYNMHEMWRTLGPRIETVVKTATPGRNDPCACGSGKKFKKCCGS